MDTVVFSHPGYYCGPGPSAVCFPDGELLVAFRRHRSWTSEPLAMHYHPTTEQCLAKAQANDLEWSPPRVFMAGGQCPCMALLRDGTLLFVTHRWEVVHQEALESIGEGWLARPAICPHICAGVETWFSTDRAERWEGPIWVDGIPGLPPILEGFHAPVSLRGFAIELSDRTIALPVYTAEHGPILVISEDDGRSWSYRGHILRDASRNEPLFNEWSLVETPSGELVAFIRSEPDYGGTGHLYTARSSDGGRNWTEPERKDVWGYPYFALTMPSGNVLLVYGYRQEAYGIRARLLDPECRKISSTEEVVLRDDGGGVDLGYPHATLLPDGRALVVYYFHDRPGGQRFIAGTLLEEA